MHRTIISTLAIVLSYGCRSRPHSATVAPLDSIHLVARAFAAYDSAHGSHDTLKRGVHAFVRNAGSVIVSLWPLSPNVQGGSGEVQLDSTGRVLSVRLYQ